MVESSRIFSTFSPSSLTPGPGASVDPFSVRSIAFTFLSASHRNQPHVNRAHSPADDSFRPPATYVERRREFHAAARANRHSTQSSDKISTSPECVEGGGRRSARYRASAGRVSWNNLPGLLVGLFPIKQLCSHTQLDFLFACFTTR